MNLSKLFAAAFLVLAANAFAADRNDLALIPFPQTVETSDGTFSLTPRTAIYVNRHSCATAGLLANRLRASTGFPLKIHWDIFSGTPRENSILLTTKNANETLGSEGYELIITTNGVIVRAPTQAGLFYGCQTLLQLLPPEIFSTNIVTENWEAPCIKIEDWPRFQWRGLMLDVSRHFFNKSEVETILDEMALYKLNRFHWHLTDDDGWRIEVKQYPKLTRIGAWRASIDLPRTEAKRRQEPAINPAWMRATADKYDSDGRYGGFYTAKDIREVVAYAAARHIMVVPEIEMPGHSGAAIASYPELGATGKRYDILAPNPFHGGVINVASPATIKFEETVLKNVFKLYPGPYVHIGGDEVPAGDWEHNADCQALMRREGFTNDFQLQSYYIRQMEKFINAHGKTLIGWSEILKGGLATNAVVMDWIGGGKQAAEAGHDAVMTPQAYCYLDHYQSTNHGTEPLAIGGYLPLKKTYSMEPVPAGLSPQLEHHILGPQGNLWTEYVASLPHAQYMIFPRLCALAEAGWSEKESRDWTNFQRRLAENEKTLDELGVNYRRSEQEPATTAAK